MDDKITNLIKTPNGREMMMDGYACSEVLIIPVWDRKLSETAIGRAILASMPETDAMMLVDICVYDQEHRRLGVADDVMDVITSIFPYVITSHQNHAGRSLCLKHGFVIQKGMHKKDADLLVWRKVNGSDVQEGARQESA